MRLYLKIILLVSLVSIVIGGLSAMVASRIMEENMKTKLEQQTFTIAQVMSEHITHNVIKNEIVPTHEALLKMDRLNDDIEHIYVIDFDRKIFSHTFESGFPRVLLEHSHEHSYVDKSFIRRYRTEEAFLFDLAYPLIDGLDAHIHIIMNEGYMHASVDSMRKQIFAFTLIIIAVGVFVSIGMSRRITSSLSNLSDSMRMFGKEGVYNELHPDFQDVEVGHLADSFNSMIIERKKAGDALAKAKDEIEEWNKELKNKIKKKTVELKQSQAQLIQSEKLSGIGQLAAGVAHELNSPLDGLLSMLRSRKKKTTEDSDEYEKMTIMVQAAEHMAGIIKDLGSFARETKNEFTKLDINNAIKSTLSFCEGIICKHGVKITKEFADNLLDIQGDKGQLQQVVLNIVNNARDSMPNGGSLTIRTRNSDDRNQVVLEFIDTGEGMGEENLSKIFEPFFTTKGPDKGVGLGLSVSLGIIKEHNGQIFAESKLGEGSKITVSLPAMKTN